MNTIFISVEYTKRFSRKNGLINVWHVTVQAGLLEMILCRDFACKPTHRQLRKMLKQSRGFYQ